MRTSPAPIFKAGTPAYEAVGSVSRTQQMWSSLLFGADLHAASVLVLPTARPCMQAMPRGSSPGRAAGREREAASRRARCASPCRTGRYAFTDGVRHRGRSLPRSAEISSCAVRTGYSPTSQAVVVDDARMGVTEVVRRDPFWLRRRARFSCSRHLGPHAGISIRPCW